MKPIERILRAWKSRHRGRSDKFVNMLDSSLDRERERIRGIDPDTDRQWKLMAAKLGRHPQAAAGPRRAFRLRLALAGASFAVVAGVAVVAGLLLIREQRSQTYETGRGEQSMITLSDSSEVRLNHTSELIVSAGPDRKDRAVTLRGEAFFRVRKNGSPFTVSTAAGMVEVLGTEFNVRAREEGFEVGVLSGTVRVRVVRGGKDSAVVLTAGQLVTCERGSFPIAPEQILFPDYPGWMHGKLLFTRASLRSVCRDIESRFDVVVTLNNSQLENTTVTGSVDARSAEKAVATIASLTGTSYRHENGGYILY